MKQVHVTLEKLSGIWQLLPFTATLTMITAASMAGVPLTNGFISKEMFFTELLASLSGSTVIFASIIIATLAGIFAVSYSIRLVHGVFFDGPVGKQVPNKMPTSHLSACEHQLYCFATLCILVGIFPALLVGPLVNSVTRAKSYAT